MLYKHKHDTVKTAANTPCGCNKRGRGGFTLIEIVVVVVIMGIISAFTAVSWSRFMQYQHLRQEALAFHKELLAQRARVLESGEEVMVGIGAGAYTIQVCTPQVDVNGIVIPNVCDWNVARQINTRDGITFNANGTAINITNGPVAAANGWTGGIIIQPDNLEAFDVGYVIIGNGTGREFLVIKGANTVRPEVFFRNNNDDDTPWRPI